MGNKLYPRWTAKRQVWMEKLRLSPGANREGVKRVGCDCMMLGWTEWVEDFSGERLTDAGRKILARWRKQAPNAEITGG